MGKPPRPVSTWRAAPTRRAIQALSLGIFLLFFFIVAWPYKSLFDASVLRSGVSPLAELYLLLDPLVSISVAAASRAMTSALVWAAVVIALSLFVPSGFCSYLCPLGTLVDVFDWLVGARVGASKVDRRGWWIHLRHLLLVALVGSAAFGVLLAGQLSAMPLLNRGMGLTVGRVHRGIAGGWGSLHPLTWTSYVAFGVFAAVFLLGLLGRRFWCRCVCPTGALFSLANAARLTERKVSSSCTGCGKCLRECAFDAIRADFTTRGLECTSCRTCKGVCPEGAIMFAWRWDERDLKAVEEPSARVASGSFRKVTRRGDERAISRRAFVGLTAGGLAAAVATRVVFAGGSRGRAVLLRPPGSVEEEKFLDLCVRCGECMKVCPGPILHPAGLEAGLEALWTPVAVPRHAGCHHDCNFCTQVCPTGAIRPLTMAQKKEAQMGLAKIDTARCLPHLGNEECSLCHDTCEAAGYHAIDLRKVELDIGDSPGGVFSDFELEAMSHIPAPFVNPYRCVGCGQCENRCHAVIHERQGKLKASAIVVLPQSTDERVSA